MWATFYSTVIDTVSLQIIRIPSVNTAQILVPVALQQQATLLADYCRAFFLDIV